MVQYITYKDKKYPVKLGYWVMLQFKQETGKDFRMTNEDLSLYEPLLYFSLQRGAEVTGQELDLKREDMMDVLDDCLFEFIGVIPQFFPELDLKN